jgi:putative tricarboxylic transport membrane protein
MSRVRSPRNLVAGFFLIALALVAFWQIQELDIGRAMKMGPGYFPRILATLIGAAGLGLIAMAMYSPGPALESWSWGRLAVVLGAIIVFALLLRPLGLILAGAVLVATASVAAPDVRWREACVFGVVLIAFAVLLFSYALNLPLPLWPAR